MLVPLRPASSNSLEEQLGEDWPTFVFARRPATLAFVRQTAGCLFCAVSLHAWALRNGKLQHLQEVCAVIEGLIRAAAPGLGLRLPWLMKRDVCTRATYPQQQTLKPLSAMPLPTPPPTPNSHITILNLHTSSPAACRHDGLAAAMLGGTLQAAAVEQGRGSLVGALHRAAVSAKGKRVEWQIPTAAPGLLPARHSAGKRCLLRLGRFDVMGSFFGSFQFLSHHMQERRWKDMEIIAIRVHAAIDCKFDMLHPGTVYLATCKKTYDKAAATRTQE